jgi:DNA-binding transcriptional MerR regulator
MGIMDDGPGLLKAGTLAKRVGVSTDTLRYYERQGLLPRPPRAANGYRAYPASALSRVELIRRGLALGISVAELAQLLGVRERGGAPCRKARSLLAEKLALLDARIVELRALRRTLRATLSDWDSRLARTPEGARASLLEAPIRGTSSGAPRRHVINRLEGPPHARRRAQS